MKISVVSIDRHSPEAMLAEALLRGSLESVGVIVHVRDDQPRYICMIDSVVSDVTAYAISVEAFMTVTGTIE